MLVLQQVSQVINQSLEVKDVANMALEESLKVLNLDCGAIRYLEEESQEIVLLAHKGLTPDMVNEMQTRPRVKLSHGPMSVMVKSGQPLIIHDIPNYSQFEYESTRYSGFLSYIGIPLKLKGRVIGTMTGLSRLQRTFTPADMEMLSSLGNMVGVAIANARLYTDLERRTRELSAVLTIDRGLAGDIPIQRALGGALIILIDAISADKGSIYLFNDKNRLELIEHHGLTAKQLEIAKATNLEDGISGEAIRRRLPMTINMSDYPNKTLGSALINEGIHALACAPIIIGERVLGVINVARTQPTIFNEQELDLLQSVSSQLAISYERTQLIHELQRRIERRDARARITAAISSSLDMETIYRALIAELPKLVEFDHLAVALFKEDKLEISAISEEYGGLFPRGMIVSPENSVLYQVVRDGKPLIRRNIEKEQAQPLDQKLLAAGIHSTLLVPLNAGGRTFGSIILASREIENYSEADLQALRDIANQLAVALDNSRLFQQVEAAAGEWRRTFDTMSDGVAIIGTDYQIKRANMALAQMLGTTPHALLGRHCYEILHGTEGPMAECPVPYCLVEKRAFERERQEPNLNNRWLHMRVDPILDTDGQVHSIVQTIRDITGEKKRQENLERLYRLSQVLSTSLNLDTVLNIALDEIVAIVGKSSAAIGIALLDEGRRELIEMSVRGQSGETMQGVTLSLSDIAEDITRLLIQERQPWIAKDMAQVPMPIKNIPGFENYKSFMAMPLVVGNRTTGVLFVASADVYHFESEELTLLQTYTRGIALAVENARLFSQTDEALKGRVAEVEAIISSMSEGLVVVNTQGKVAYCNQAAEHLLGLKAIDFLNQPVKAFNDFLNTQVIEPANWRDTLAEGLKHAAQRPKLRFATQFFQRRELELVLFAIDSSGQRLGTGAVIRDITREREIDRMKSEFVSIASHELRTPMTVIYGFTELLLLRARELPEEHRQWIEKVYNESKRLTNIVDDFLNVSSIESGRISVKREVLSIQPIINRLMGQISINYPAHTFSMNIPDNFPMVLADAERLTQVMYNLIDNAAKYSPRGGSVIISANKEDMVAQAVITVADNGLGIPEEEMPRLFTRFHRVFHPEAEGTRGTGLGLYIVKSLVEMMGGQVWAESQLNKGSKFCVALPLEKPIAKQGTG